MGLNCYHRQPVDYQSKRDELNRLKSNFKRGQVDEFYEPFRRPSFRRGLRQDPCELFRTCVEVPIPSSSSSIQQSSKKAETKISLRTINAMSLDYIQPICSSSNNNNNNSYTNPLIRNSGINSMNNLFWWLTALYGCVRMGPLTG